MMNTLSREEFESLSTEMGHDELIQQLKFSNMNDKMSPSRLQELYKLIYLYQEATFLHPYGYQGQHGPSNYEVVREFLLERIKDVLPTQEEIDAHVAERKKPLTEAQVEYLLKHLIYQ